MTISKLMADTKLPEAKAAGTHAGASPFKPWTDQDCAQALDFHRRQSALIEEILSAVSLQEAVLQEEITIRIGKNGPSITLNETETLKIRSMLIEEIQREIKRLQGQITTGG
jgi:hypothetical protein